MSVFDIFCERGPYRVRYDLNRWEEDRDFKRKTLEKTNISKTKSGQRDYIVVNTILT